ncbi:MAG: sensor histidine kinase [Mycetocola sp.]
MTSPSDPAAPLPRWAWITLTLVAIALASVSAPLNAVFYGVPVAIALVLAVLHAGSILAATAWPRTAVVASTGTVAALGVFASSGSGVLWPIGVTTLLTQLAVITVLGLRARLPYGLAAWTLPACIAIVQIWLNLGRTDELALANVSIITFLSNGAFVLAVSLLTAQRSRIRGQLLTERRQAEYEHERLRAVEEKTRIARELHDVVAHGLSLIQVQASSAPYRLSDVPPDVRDEFAQISSAARSSMSEMRRILSLLRDDTERVHTEPQPDLTRLPELVASVRDTGTPISYSSRPAPLGDVPPVCALNAYRLVQEALSNALRHAPGAAITVTVERTESELLVTVHNTAVPAPRVDSARGPSTALSDASTQGSGYGLIGMSERVRLLDGSLSSGPTPDGGFHVHARLPLAPTEGHHS